ncbi:MAG: GNAT family N-acetyltransferase [Acidimicrobiaceae bacterium]|nr:GNAT family N-acetyltransferase [Acidimicrobiaceae bacterium]
MTVTVVHPRELGPHEVQQWAEFERSPSLGSPFLSAEFARIVGEVRDDARVAVVDEGHTTCAYFPFQIDEERVGRPIGASIADAQAVMCDADWEFDARELIAAAGLASWHFDHLVVSQLPFAPYHRQRHRAPLVDLQRGHEHFLLEVRAQSKDLLAQVGRRRRKLEREVGPVVCEWQSSHPEHDLRRLQQWKSGQYARDETWDRFASPWIAETVGRLTRSRDPGCTGVLTSLVAGDRLVAAHFGLRGQDRLSWWFPAYDPEFGRYSPGLILLLAVIKEASERAVPVVDLGRGEHGYKLRVTPHFSEVAEGCVVSTPP